MRVIGEAGLSRTETGEGGDGVEGRDGFHRFDYSTECDIVLEHLHRISTGLLGGLGGLRGLFGVNLFLDS
jgi:hypothetical protein